MKKKYIVPEMLILLIQQSMPLAGSGVSNEIYDMGYGGVDTEGDIEPNVKEEIFDDPYEEGYEDDGYYSSGYYY